MTGSRGALATARRAIVAVVFAAVAGACNDPAADGDSSDGGQVIDSAGTAPATDLEVRGDSTTSAGTPAATDPVASDAPAVPAVSGEGFFCGEFGAEVIPTVFAVDIATGLRRWAICPSDVRIPPLYILGRARDVTLLVQQDGVGGNETFAVDDAGVELWRRTSVGVPGSIDLPTIMIGGTTVVTVDDPVVAYDAVTGDDRWQHPVAEGTPVAAAGGLIVEIAGGPYAPPGSEANPADAGKATLRALDENTGEQRWSRPVQVVPMEPPNQYSPTVGNGFLALPTGVFTGTAIIDIATGADVRQVPELVLAAGDLVVEVDAMYRVAAVSNATTGEQLGPVPAGSPTWYITSAEHPISGSQLLLVASTGRQSVTSLVDAATGETLWSVDDGFVVGRTDTHTVVSAGSSIRLLESETGAVVWTYSSPTPNVSLSGGALGDGVVVIVPNYTGD